MVDQPSHTIASFRELQGNRARAQFLQDLISELTPYERRELNKVLSQETHQIDIVSSLPLELVQIVLQYLDVAELFSLRRVSRRWLGRLASHDVCRTMLCRAFPEETTFVDSNDLDPPTRLLSKVQQRHAFRTGRPYSKASLPVKLNFGHMPRASKTPIRKLDYHDGKLVSVDMRSGTAIAHTLNLMNGRHFGIAPRNREGISQVKISDTLVAFITKLGVCQVYDHRTEEGHCFHLPSLPTVRMSVAARQIAIVGFPAEAGFAPVLLRNFDTQNSKLLNLVLGSDSYVQGVVLHPGGDAFYLIAAGRRGLPFDQPVESSCARIEFLKFNFQGQLTCRRECWTESQWVGRKWGFDPAVSGSHYTIALGTKYRDYWTGNTTIIEDHYIVYDMESEKVVYEKSAREVSEPEYGSCQASCPRPLRQSMRWNDIIYFAWYKGRRLESILVQNVKNSPSAQKTEILNVDTYANLEKRSARIMRHGNDLDDYWLVGDERFLVLINYNEVQVWCFEKDLVMPGDEPHYRAERTQRAAMRAAERRVHATKT